MHFDIYAQEFDANMLNSPDYKKQLDHQLAEETFDDNGKLTVFALGGFLPDYKTNLQIETFFKTSPQYRPSFLRMGKPMTPTTIVRLENEYRLVLVDKMNKFLDSLNKFYCSVRRASKVSGLNRTTAELLRRRVPEFARIWDEIYLDVTDKIEEAAIGRAVVGVTKDVYYKGLVVGKEKVYSDNLLNTLLQSRRPEVYRPHISQEISGNQKNPIKYEEVNRPRTKAELIAELESRGLPTTIFDDYGQD